MHYVALLYYPDGTPNGPCCATHLDEGHGGRFYLARWCSDGCSGAVLSNTFLSLCLLQEAALA